MLREIVSGSGKRGDIIRIICGQRKSKYESVANSLPSTGVAAAAAVSYNE